MKKLIPLLTALILALSACSASSSDMMTSAGEMMMERGNASVYEETVAATMAAPDGGTAFPEEPAMSGEFIPDVSRKLIRTAHYDMETMDYDKTIQGVEELVAHFNGYIQSSSATGSGAAQQSYQINRYAYFTVRVPVESFFDFGRELANCGSITSSSQNAQEVTDYYYDTEARLNTLRVQEERLLALMSQATELEAVIQLESSLADVRYQIESHEGTLRRLDSQISYSTIEISIQEVFEPTRVDPVPRTLGERIGQRFRSTWENIVRLAERFIVWFFGGILEILLTLAALGAVILAIRYAVRRHRAWQRSEKPKKEKDNTDEPEEPEE